MAEENSEYEKKPLLADRDDGDQPSQEKKEEPVFIPPPAYEPPSKPVILPTPEFTPVNIPKEEGGASLPLPTYDQSEKYEKEGVLELGSTNNATPIIPARFDGSIRIFTRQSDQPLGSWADFIIFFIVCFLFSWLGYIFACCLATSVAAQSGSAAGLGMSLIIKTIFVEFQPSYLTDMVRTMCAGDYYYDGDDYSSSCSTRSYNFLRLMFWIMGFLGLFLFARGLSVFCHTRGRNNITRT